MNIKQIIAAALFFLLCGAELRAQQTETLYVIEGRFYREVPKSLSMSCVGNFNMIKDNDGRVYRELALLPECTLGAEEIALALPENEAKALKEKLQAARNKYEFTVLIPSMDLEGEELIPDLLAEGDTLPDFRVTDTEGRTWTRQETLGAPLVLNFWHTACRACVHEMPDLSEWTRRFPKTHFLAMTWNSAEQIAEIVNRKQFLFRQVASDKVLWPLFGVLETPETVIIDKQGVIRRVMIGTSEEKRAELVALLEELQ